MKEKDRASLRLFCERIDRIKRTQLIRQIEEHGLHVEIWELPDGKIEPKFPPINETEIDAFLFNWRLMVNDKDKISVRCIKIIVEGSELSGCIKNRVLERIAELNAFLKSPPLMNGHAPATNETLLNTVLNGRFAHLDRNKAKKVAYWENAFGHEQFMSLFVVTLHESWLKLVKVRQAVHEMEAHLDAGRSIQTK